MKGLLITILIILNSVFLLGQSKGCRCFDGIGSSSKDTPILVAKFPNGQILSVCGYLEKRNSTTEALLSEFNIFNCETGESLVEYGALENCIVHFENAVLTVDKFVLLPAGNNWEWKYVSTGLQKIFIEGNAIVVSSLSPNYVVIEIPQNRINSFFNEIKELQGKGYNKAFEEIIGKLEILALNKNILAYNILMDFNNYFGFVTDGSTAEQLNDAISTIKFITKRDMH
jgi:hypothetical protein